MTNPQPQNPNQAPPPVGVPVAAPAPQPSWPPADATVVCYRASKNFGPLVAVSDVSVAFRPGVTGLLGPNGAGKSTLIRLISGQAKPSIGKIWVAGGDPRKSAQARKRISIVPQQDGVFENLTALEFVKLSATINGVANAEEAARWALNQVDLDPNITKPLIAFSKGMRQRAKIAYAMTTNPAVIILDEPLNGLDPKQRRQAIEVFTKLGDAGKTVIVSSHILEEVERFGSHIVVLSKGRLAAEGRYQQIRERMDQQARLISVECQNAPQVGGTLIARRTVEEVKIVDDTNLKIRTTDPRQFRYEIANECKRANSRLWTVRPEDDDLESVFKYLVGDK